MESLYDPPFLTISSPEVIDLRRTGLRTSP